MPREMSATAMEKTKTIRQISLSVAERALLPKEEKTQKKQRSKYRYIPIGRSLRKSRFAGSARS